MLSEYLKLVYANGRYKDNTLLCAYLRSILLFQDFFLKIFDCLCVLCVLSVFLFGLVFFFFFFASLHINMKSRKKKNNIKNNNNLRTGRTNTLLCQSFYRLSREKNVKSMCYLKTHIKVYLMH